MKEEERKTKNELGIEVDYYEMKETHSIAFLAVYESDQEMVNVVKKIPESDMMQVIIVEYQTEEELA